MVLIVEWTEGSSEESGGKTISEANVQAEIQMAQKEDVKTEIMIGNIGILYERLISNLKSEINFLKSSVLCKEHFFPRRNYVYLQKTMGSHIERSRHFCLSLN